MPLTIHYRPVILPPSASASPVEDMARPVPAHAVPAHERARDFAARIRRRDMISARRALRAPGVLRQRAAGIAAMGLLGMVLGPIGWGAPGGIDAAQAHARVAGLQPFEQAGDSFPGSAFYYVAADDTGLLAPGDAERAWKAQAGAAHRDDADATGPAARPLTVRGTGNDQWRALQCLTAAIYYEAASEPDAGQRAVAQVVLNRLSHPAFPKTVCGVVYQGSERPGCQFSFACDGSLARQPVRPFWDRARRVAADALAGFVYAPIGLATHYHTSAVHPYWADSLAFIGTIGAHRFYRWSGAAGQPAAFTAAYAGGEPIAAPHPRTWTPSPADIADPVALEKAYETGRIAPPRPVPGTATHADTAHADTAGQAPVFAPAIEQRGGDSVFRAGGLPGGSGVNAAYENAGKWIAQPTG